MADIVVLHHPPCPHQGFSQTSFIHVFIYFPFLSLVGVRKIVPQLRNEVT